ncbi:MAG: hypothetical protein M3296_03300 [Actinomycetota bacterium]|nr:hypothetical protein [Actinomycetota bacterium]
MSILARFAPRGTTSTEQYDEVIRRLEESGDFPPDGLELHVCFLAEGNVRVSEVWESQEKLDAYAERLMPVLSEVGVDSGEPEILEVYNVVTP